MARRISLVLVMMIFWQSFFNCPLQAQQPYPEEWYPPKLWTYNTSGRFVLVNDIPFIFEQDKGFLIITRLNRNNGSKIWSSRFEMYSDGNAGYGDTISLNRLFITDPIRKTILCIDSQVGELLWEKNLESYFNENSREDDISCPTAICDRVFISTHSSLLKTLICLDVTTGEVIWENCDNEISYLSTIIKKYGDYIYCCYDSDDGIRCINYDDGKTIWFGSWRAPVDVDRIAFDKDNVYCFISCCDYYYLYVFNLKDGNCVVSKKKLPTFVRLFYDGKIIYQDPSTHNIVCSNLYNDTTIWEIDLEHCHVFNFVKYNGYVWMKGIPDYGMYCRILFCFDPNDGRIITYTGKEIEQRVIESFSEGRIYTFLKPQYLMNNKENRNVVCFGDPAIGFDEPPSTIVE